MLERGTHGCEPKMQTWVYAELLLRLQAMRTTCLLAVVVERYNVDTDFGTATCWASVPAREGVFLDSVCALSAA